MILIKDTTMQTQIEANKNEKKISILELGEDKKSLNEPISFIEIILLDK